MELTLTNALAAVGATTLLSTAYKLASFARLYIRSSSLPRYLETPDGSPPWALVTGASDGIGKAFAANLASRGFNIALHGRNPAKLARVKTELKTQFPARDFRVIVADASQPSAIDFPAIAKSVSDIRIKVLFNNVGSTMPRGHEFDSIEAYTAAELEANVAANFTFTVLLTGALMPNLTANQPSLILNTESAIDIGLPLFPAYGPAKAGLKGLTDELAMEQAFHGRDIEVLGLRTLQVTDTGTIVVPPSLFAPVATAWVASAVQKIGCGRRHVMVHLPHAFQTATFEALPDFIVTKIKVSATHAQLQMDPTGAKAEAAAEAAKKAKKEL